MEANEIKEPTFHGVTTDLFLGDLVILSTDKEYPFLVDRVISEYGNREYYLRSLSMDIPLPINIRLKFAKKATAH